MGIQILHIGVPNTQTIDRLIARIPRSASVMLDNHFSNRLPLMRSELELGRRLIENGNRYIYANFDTLSLIELDHYKETTAKHNDLIIIASDVNYSVLFNKLQKKRSFFVTHI